MKTYLFILLGLVITLPLAVHGQTNTFAPLNPSLPGIKEFVGSNSIPDLLNNIYKICIGIAAVLAVLQIMRAGVLYMGGDSITEKKEARDLISMSVIGLVLVLAPTIVFSIINPDILQLKIGASSLKVETTTPVNGAGAQAAAQCSQYAATNLKAVTLAQGQTCDAKLGTGYAAVDCCQNLPTGSTCCGYDAANDHTAPGPITSPGTFKFHRVVKDTSILPACSISENSNNYTTRAACVATFNSDQQNPKVVVDGDCDGNSINPPQPVARWNTFKSLPACQL